MLVKDTKGRVLTDVHGRPMTTKDRWHPLVTSFIKRVLQDGGEIISPAIEEMNEMAWEGKFDDALYVYFAAARKAGKTYALIPNDGSGDLDVERNSVAWEWEKYRTLDEIVNDMPEMEFDPTNGGFNGIAIKSQSTNLFLQNQNPADWDNNQRMTLDLISDPTFPFPVIRALETTDDGEHRASNIVGNVMSSGYYSFVVKPIGRRYLVLGQSASTAPSNRLIFDFQDKTIMFNPFGGGTDRSEFLNFEELPNGWFLFLIRSDFWDSSNGHARPTITCLETSGTLTSADNSQSYAGDPTKGFLCANVYVGEEYPNTILNTDGSAVTRLADDIEDIPVPMGATEIIQFVDGVETIIDSNLPATWEFPENSTTKYVIIK